MADTAPRREQIPGFVLDTRAGGDSDPGDSRRGTFLPVFSTPRAHARFPVYLLMNAGDRFVRRRVKRVEPLWLHGELRWIRLANVRAPAPTAAGKSRSM